MKSVVYDMIGPVSPGAGQRIAGERDVLQSTAFLAYRQGRLHMLRRFPEPLCCDAGEIADRGMLLPVGKPAGHRLLLMAARRDVRKFKDDRQKLDIARERVGVAKIALGERGPVWWDDGAPDYNRHMAENTPYADWYTKLSET